MNTNTDKHKTANASQNRVYKAIEQYGYDEASEQFRTQGCFSSGRTWHNDNEANEAYDRGVNRAEAEYKAQGKPDLPETWRNSPNRDTRIMGRMTELRSHAEALAEALRDLTAEVKLGKLNIRKDFSLINAHASATKALYNWEKAKQ